MESGSSLLVKTICLPEIKADIDDKIVPKLDHRQSEIKGQRRPGSLDVTCFLILLMPRSE